MKTSPKSPQVPEKPKRFPLKTQSLVSVSLERPISKLNGSSEKTEKPLKVIKMASKSLEKFELFKKAMENKNFQKLQAKGMQAPPNSNIDIKKEIKQKKIASFKGNTQSNKKETTTQSNKQETILTNKQENAITVKKDNKTIVQNTKNHLKAQINKPIKENEIIKESNKHKKPENSLRESKDFLRKNNAGKPKTAELKKKKDLKPQILNIFESTESMKPTYQHLSPKKPIKTKIEKHEKPKKTTPTPVSKNKENQGKSAKKDLKNALGVLLNITESVANEEKAKPLEGDMSPELSLRKYDRILDYAMRMSVEVQRELEELGE